MKHLESHEHKVRQQRPGRLVETLLIDDARQNAADIVEIGLLLSGYTFRSELSDQSGRTTFRARPFTQCLEAALACIRDLAGDYANAVNTQIELRPDDGGVRS